MAYEMPLGGGIHRISSLGLASRHPALNALESGAPGGSLVAARLRDFRVLIERLEALTAADPHAAPVAVDTPGF